MWRLNALVAVLGIGAVLPAAAGAASVAVVKHSVDASSSCARDPGSCDFWVFEYTAAARERNDIVLTAGADGITVRDAGAEIAAGPGCVSASSHEARCTGRDDGISHLVVDAGDLGDEVANTTALHSRIAGGPGNDLLSGGRVTDTLYAGRGRDRLVGRGGGDNLYDGKDGGAVEPDVMDGGAGEDTVSYRMRMRRVRVNLADPGFEAGQAGEADRLSGIDAVYGGRGNDVLIGSSGSDLISGAPGKDRIRGGPGDDSLWGDGGGDKMYGEAGADLLEGGNGSNVLVGGCGRDRLHGGESSDRIYAADGRRDEVVGWLGIDTAVVDRGRLDRIDGLERVRRSSAVGGCAR